MQQACNIILGVSSVGIGDHHMLYISKVIDAWDDSQIYHLWVKRLKPNNHSG